MIGDLVLRKVKERNERTWWVRPSCDIGIREYWFYSPLFQHSITPFFLLLIPTIPILQHSIIPCGWHKPIILRDNGILQKPRKLPRVVILTPSGSSVML